MAISWTMGNNRLEVSSPPSGDFTVMAWVMRTATDLHFGTFFICHKNWGTDTRWCGIDDDGERFGVSCSANEDYGTALTINTWYNACMTDSDDNDRTRGYLDGVLNVNFSQSANRSIDTFTIGDVAGIADCFSGRMAYVKAWNAELTADEIKQEMHVIRPVRTDDLWGWWPFFPGSSERLRDYSGNGRDLTESGTVNDGDPPPVSWGTSPIFVVPAAIGAGGQTISPSAIVSAEAFGTVVIQPGTVTVTPSAIVTAEAFGTVTIQPGAVIVAPSAIVSGEAHGTPTVTPGTVTVEPIGITTDEAFGTATIQPGAVIVAPSAIVSGEAHGTPTVIPGPVTIVPSGITTGEAFGTATLSPGAVTVSPSGIGSLEAFGTPLVSTGILYIQPTGIAGAEAFGTPVLLPGAVTILPGGIATAEAFGSHTVSPGTVIIAPSSVASEEAFGSAMVLPGGVVLIPTGIASAEAFGTAWVGQLVGMLLKLLGLYSFYGGFLMTRQIEPGSTDQSVEIRIVDSTTGLPEEGVTSATPGLSLWYRREGGAKVAISPSDLSALTDAHTDGGLLHIDDGYYRLDVPDAAFAANAENVVIGGTATGMMLVGREIQLAAQVDGSTALSAIAAMNWAYASRTLTQAADSLEEITSGSLIVRKRGDYWSISRTGVGSLAGRTACYFTVKKDRGQTDAQALLKIEETAGLQVFDGDDDMTASDASLTIDDEAAGDYTVVVKVALTAEIDPDTYAFDLQPVFANGPTTMEEGQFKVTSDVTRATS